MLRIHFLNVGHGDCTVIEHPSGRLTMIDINNSQNCDTETLNEEVAEERRQQGGYISSSLLQKAMDTAVVEARAKIELEEPIGFMQRIYPGKSLWRFILTHPDMDHMRGVKALYDNVGFDNFWDTNHTKATPEFRTDADEEDWAFYQKLRKGNVGPCVRHYQRGASNFAFHFDAGGDCIEVLSPSTALVAECNRREISNDLSMVLRVHHAGKTVLLPGDAEMLAWTDMRETYGERLKSDFLKASHHGRHSGFDVEAVKLIAPRITIVSVGKAPATDASRKYVRATGNRSASTRRYGNIELRIQDNGEWSWYVQRNSGE